MSSKPVTLKAMLAEVVAAVKMMSTEAEGDARPISIIARIVTVARISGGIRASNVTSRRPIAPAIIVADQMHSLEILIAPGSNCRVW